MSPMSWIDGGEPPFLIIHGTQDQNVQAALSKDFAAALEEADVDVRLVLPEAEHGFMLQPLSSPSMSLALDSIISFVDEIARH
jgi:dipeptidyl aminopeptidase/acylaminoacyl peptidase